MEKTYICPKTRITVMRVNIKFAIAIAGIAIGAAVAAPVSAQKRLSTIVIDPGHGGKDPGALGKNSREKDIVLSVALKLGKMLNDSMPDLKTVYTRDKDVFVELNKRAEIANKNKADLFVSIHTNWAKSPTIQGSETFVLGLHRSKENLEVAQKENSVILLEDDYSVKYDGFNPNETESYVIFGLMQSVNIDLSAVMARYIQQEFEGVSRVNRGEKQAGFLVLRETSMPSVLLELGFLSNAKEEAYLTSESGQAELVKSIFTALKQYRHLYEENANPSLKTKPEQVDNESGIWFRVQIASREKPMENMPDKFGTVMVKHEDGRFKYMVYKTRDYREAVKLMKEVKPDFSDCFIVAYEDGKKVTVKYARKRLE